MNDFGVPTEPGLYWFHIYGNWEPVRVVGMPESVKAGHFTVFALPNVEESDTCPLRCADDWVRKPENWGPKLTPSSQPTAVHVQYKFHESSFNDVLVIETSHAAAIEALAAVDLAVGAAGGNIVNMADIHHRFEVACSSLREDGYWVIAEELA